MEINCTVKHPAPWAWHRDTKQVEDARGIVVACDVTEAVARLILAAPEMRAFVLKLDSHDLDAKPGWIGLNLERDRLISMSEVRSG